MSGYSGKIEHIVVLMLENRSFDNMLGQLYPKSMAYNGLAGDETNPVHLNGLDQIVTVWSRNFVDPINMTIPTPDPGELWTDMNEQIFGPGAPPGDYTPPMTGFAQNYAKQGGGTRVRDIMHFFLPDQVSVLSHLAKAFAVCDQWYASAPCQTWPNRFFTHCGTAHGYVNDLPTHFPYEMRTVFNMLSEKEGLENPWKVYFHDFPQALALSKLWPYVEWFTFYETSFHEDVANGRLPAYSFIEPRYFPDSELPNDMHPPHDVCVGEQLIADVYNTLRSAPTWNKTLLVITFDEHGGCYDHAPPPLAVRPDDVQNGPFPFDRYGVRVPTVVISPYIPAGTILRAVPNGTVPHKGPPYPFDHTSLIATVRKCFELGGALTQRDAVAPDLGPVLQLDRPANSGPVYIPIPPYEGTPEEKRQALNEERLSDLQNALLEAAATLPGLSAVMTDAQRLESIQNHLDALIGGIFQPSVPSFATVAEALLFIKLKLGTFLGVSL